MGNEQNKEKELVKAQPEILPLPTYMPFLLVISVVFLAWGLISTWIFCAAGLLGMIYSLTGWIKELLYERRNDS